ncbi:hypothetical protein OG806_46100 [Streptomyces sp. NBC_00882]|uniref:hypothetical protein n=1 Tax=Streptomyces TaxID=1883 RepID=UPI00386718AD|nr:hypothetical protein OG806_46100 [Streptomyces sp. NBC_00882]WSZ63202.1 hypothetical protein OH824_44965 [Streptomyces canus]
MSTNSGPMRTLISTSPAQFGHLGSGPVTAPETGSYAARSWATRGRLSKVVGVQGVVHW